MPLKDTLRVIVYLRRGSHGLRVAVLVDLFNLRLLNVLGVSRMAQITLRGGGSIFHGVKALVDFLILSVSGSIEQGFF